MEAGHPACLKKGCKGRKWASHEKKNYNSHSNCRRLLQMVFVGWGGRRVGKQQFASTFGVAGGGRKKWSSKMLQCVFLITSRLDTFVYLLQCCSQDMCSFEKLLKRTIFFCCYSYFLLRLRLLKPLVQSMQSLSRWTRPEILEVFDWWTMRGDMTLAWWYDTPGSLMLQESEQPISVTILWKFVSWYSMGKAYCLIIKFSLFIMKEDRLRGVCSKLLLRET